MSSKKVMSAICFWFNWAVIFSLLTVPLTVSTAWSAPDSIERPKIWTAHRDPKLGFTVYYPPDWFAPADEQVLSNGKVFTSKEGDARLAALGMLDPKWLGAELFDKKIISGDGRVADELAFNLYTGDLREEGGAYENITKKEMGTNWMVLEGTRGDRFYFEKFIFSCKDKVINVLSYSFPQSKKEKYASILKTLVRRFSAGSGSQTPRCL